ncbi:PfkB family carbohydrate kinase [Algoriella sp.]|uniref:PfkB family carbohydrate kinase n=1 Tax=Algoriella sp. TaxID=1872434 RepID=UPI002FC9740F
MSLLTVGTVAFDKLESPFGKTDKILGGAATYIGMASSLLGVDTAIVSVVGGDFPQEYIDLLTSKGINLDGLEIVKEGKTFFWEGRYHNDLNTRDTLVTELNVLETFNPVVPQNYKSPEVLMLGNLHPLVQKGVLTQLDKRPSLVILDTMNFWMDIAWDDLMDVIKDVDVISINDEEARQMSGEYSLVKAAKKIMTLGPKTVIIKKGEHGALLFQGEDVFFAPALPLEDVFDPTGAGDTFAGGFSGYLAKTNDFSFDNMKRAIVYGSALASVTCEKFGTESLQALTRDGLAERLKEFKKLMDFSITL